MYLMYMFMFPFSSYLVLCDKLSYVMLILTFLVYYICINMVKSSSLRLNLFFLFVLCCFFFLVSDFFILLFLFESSLIFIYLIVMGWGYTQERLMAGYYLVMYMILYSFPLILMVLFFGMEFNSLLYLNKLIYLDMVTSLLLLIPFMLKCPVYFFHLWLPKAHVEASVVGSIILAGVLLKLGTYGFYRMVLMFKISSYLISILIFMLIIGMILSSMVCMLQSDQKSMIAYMSVNHMSFLVLSIMLYSSISSYASMSMMFFHGLISSMLFYSSYLMFYSSYNRVIFLNFGYFFVSIGFMLFFILFIIYNLSIPILSSFFSEWMMYSVLLSYSFVFIVVMVFCMMILAYLSFFLMSNSFHGKSMKYMWDVDYILLVFCGVMLIYMPWIF